MDWNAAIEKNREALKRIVAALVAMAAVAGSAPTLPRHLHRAVLRLLRPAESAVRRLIIVAARGLAAPPPSPPRSRKAKPAPTILRNGVGTGILMPHGVLGALTLPHKGIAHVSESPGVRGGGKSAPARTLAFQLLDPLRRQVLRRPVANSVPRISLPGYTKPFPVAARRPLLPGDPVDAARLYLRLSALASALDDLPAQARRFARWRARRDAGAQVRNPGRVRRIGPLRFGRPPGERPAKNGRSPHHEVHDVLNDVHGLAFWALERPDTS